MRYRYQKKIEADREAMEKILLEREAALKNDEADV